MPPMAPAPTQNPFRQADPGAAGVFPDLTDLLSKLAPPPDPSQPQLPMAGQQDQWQGPATPPPTADEVMELLGELKPMFTLRDALLRLCRRVSRMSGLRALEDDAVDMDLTGNPFKARDKMTALSLPATLLEKAAEQITMRDSIVECERDEDNAPGRAKAENQEELVRVLEERRDRLWQQGGNSNTFRYAALFSLLEDGCLYGILRKEFEDESCPIRLDLVDALTMYPMFDGEKIAAAIQELLMHPVDIARAFGPEATYALAGKPALTKVTVYYDSYWMVAVINREVVKGVYHNYGFCPVRARFIGGRRGAIDHDLTLEDREANRGWPVLFKLIPELEEIYRQADALLKAARYNANPAYKVIRNAGQKTVPEVLLEPGEPNDLQTGEDVLPIIIDPAGLTHIQSALQMLAGDVYSATLNLADDRNAASTSAFLAMAEEKHTFLKPFVDAVCSFDAQNDRDSLCLLKTWPFPIRSGTKFYSADDIADVPEVKRRLNMYTRMEMIQAMSFLQGSLSTGLFSREFAIDHFLGIPNAGQIIRAADLDRAAQGPLAMQEQAAVGAARWLQAEAKRVAEQGDNPQEAAYLQAKYQFVMAQLMQSTQPPNPMQMAAMAGGQGGGAPGGPPQMPGRSNGIDGNIPGQGPPQGSPVPGRTGLPPQVLTPEAATGGLNRFDPTRGMPGQGTPPGG